MSTATARPLSPTADDLSFTKRNENAALTLWTLPPVDSEFWNDHYQQGKAAGEEYLNYVLTTTEELEGEEWSISLPRLIQEIVITELKAGTDGISHGFLEVIQHYLRTGRAPE